MAASHRRQNIISTFAAGHNRGLFMHFFLVLGFRENSGLPGKPQKKSETAANLGYYRFRTVLSKFPDVKQRQRHSKVKAHQGRSQDFFFKRGGGGGGEESHTVSKCGYSRDCHVVFATYCRLFALKGLQREGVTGTTGTP